MPSRPQHQFIAVCPRCGRNQDVEVARGEPGFPDWARRDTVRLCPNRHVEADWVL